MSAVGLCRGGERSVVARVGLVVAAFALVVAGLVAVRTLPVDADGTETLGPPSIPIASGSGVTAGGVGMRFSDPATISVSVPEGATVNQVLLYWEGYFDQNDLPANLDSMDVVVAGTDVTGMRIGGPTVFFTNAQGTATSVSYRADITSLGVVSAGANSVTVGDLDFNFRTNGAGIMVIYSDAAGTEAIIDVRDGNDLAFFGRPPTLDATVPQTFTFEPADVDRTASFAIFASSVADEGPRPNALKVTLSDGTEELFVDLFDSNDGPEWDTDTGDFLVPAGVSSVTVEAISAPDGTGNKPASLNWLMGAIALEPAPETPPTTTVPPTTAPPTTAPPTTVAPTTTVPPTTTRPTEVFPETEVPTPIATQPNFTG